MPNIYAGFGSRPDKNIPPKVIALAEKIGLHLARKGWTNRNGDCPGMDWAFKRGHLLGMTNELAGMETYRPEDATEESIAIAARLHDNWEAAKRKPNAVNLLGRNPFLILGKDLNKPAKMAICWTPGAKIVGGSAIAMRLAIECGVPLYNLANPATFDIMAQKVGFKNV
jgi:hypothetical protein